MGLIVLRTAVIFIALLAVMRLMGKRQIGEMQPFELVITLLIAELACIPMADTSIPLLYGIVSILTIFLLHQVMLLIDLKWKPFKTIVGGKPSVVINKNGVDISQLKKNHLDLSDLIESMRTAGYFSLDEVAYALYEANGQFTAMPREDAPKETWRDLVLDDAHYRMAKQRLMALFALVCALPGMPTIYYGDEAGMQGAGDPIQPRRLSLGA